MKEDDNVFFERVRIKLPYADVPAQNVKFDNTFEGAASESRNTYKRAAVVEVDDPLFAFYWGRECTQPFRGYLEATQKERQKTPSAERLTQKYWMMRGVKMLGLACGMKREGWTFTVGVEAMCLLYFLKTDLKTGLPRECPASEKWWSFPSRSDMMFVAYRCGWTGVVAEWRFWVALWWHLIGEGEGAVYDNVPMMKAGDFSKLTLSTVRGWYDEELLDDFVNCVTYDKVYEMLKVMCEVNAMPSASKSINAFTGAPDLVFWSNTGKLWFVEVKSSKDAFDSAQARCLRALSTFGTCRVCYSSKEG